MKGKWMWIIVIILAVVIMNKMPEKKTVAINESEVPLIELCDGIDNDGDGIVDEGLTCPGDAWVPKIKNEHPRMFFTKDQVPSLKAVIPQAQSYYNLLTSTVNGYPLEVTTTSVSQEYGYMLNGTLILQPKPKNWGNEAAKSALMYTLTDDPVYLAKTKKMLNVSLKAFKETYDAGMYADWHANVYKNWLFAYDWVYNNLTTVERKDFANRFLDIINSYRYGTRPVYRVNWGDGNNEGGYGFKSIYWYAGLAFYNNGYNDSTALSYLKEGYTLNRDLFLFRALAAGQDGGLSSSAPGYALGMYPFAQWNFIYTWKSSTNEDISNDWPHLAYLTNWINWIQLPGYKTYGLSDESHVNNEFAPGYLYTHLSIITQLYKNSLPQYASYAAYLKTQLKGSIQSYNTPIDIYPFLLDINQVQPSQGVQPAYAKNFEKFGTVMMNSNGTYAVFNYGTPLQVSHKNYDSGHFTIYKDGFLAMDTGTREDEFNFGYYNLRHYMSQSVAHNVLLVHKPNEPFPSYWGEVYPGPEGQLNCGGQTSIYGAKLISFASNNYFTYATADETPTYSTKLDKYTRKFIFIYPDTFVIFDIVKSKDPTYKKEWLLHTQNEPVINNNEFQISEGAGKMYGKVLLPADYYVTKVGGVGMEFYACGVNYELSPATVSKYPTNYFGKWRIVTSPTEYRSNDLFLQVLQTKETSTLNEAMTQTADYTSLSLDSGGKRYTLYLANQEDGGAIDVYQNGQFVERDSLGEVSFQLPSTPSSSSSSGGGGGGGYHPSPQPVINNTNTTIPTEENVETAQDNSGIIILALILIFLLMRKK